MFLNARSETEIRALGAKQYRRKFRPLTIDRKGLRKGREHGRIDNIRLGARQDQPQDSARVFCMDCQRRGRHAYLLPGNRLSIRSCVHGVPAASA